MICSFLIKRFKNWRIRSQIFFIQFVTITIVIKILGLCVLANFIGIFSILESDAQQQLIMKFIYSSTNSQLQAYKDNLRSKLNEGMNNIENYNRLNQLIYQTNMNFSQLSEQCLQEHISDHTKIMHLNQYCYGIFDCSKQISVNRSAYIPDMIRLSTLMTQMIPFQEGPDLYFTLISSDCYFSYYPGNNFDNYVPSIRPWYQEYMQKKNSSTYIITEPFLGQFKAIYQAISGGLYDRNKNIIGIGGFDLNFTTVYPRMPNDQKFIVIDSHGNIIVSQLYTPDSATVYSLYNQSLFGFTTEDVDKIINFNHGLDESCQISVPDTICAMDLNAGQLWYVRKTYVTKESILLIMFTSENYEQYIELLRSTIKATYFRNLVTFFYGFIILLFFSFIFYLLTQIILYRPIYKLINSFNMCLIEGKKKQYLIFNPANSDQLDKLSEAFVRLTTQSNYHKHIDYEEIMKKESIDFPVNHYKNSKLRGALEEIFVIQSNIQNLDEYDDQIHFVNEFHKTYRKSIVMFKAD